MSNDLTILTNYPLPEVVMNKKAKRNLITIFFITCLLNTVFAEENNISTVSLFDNPVTVRLSLQLPFFLVCIKPESGENETPDEEDAREDAHISYMPNIRLSGGVGLYYKGFGASYINKITNISDTDKRGATKFTDIRLSEYYRKFGADFIYMDYKGFYLTDAGEHGYSTGQPETKRSDMQLKIVSISGYYIFSDDFSMRAAFMQNERQNEWDWTIIAVLSTVYQSLKSDYSLIPPENESAFGSNAGMEDGVFKGYAAGAGFGLTVPYRDYLFTVVSYFGSGYMLREYKTYEGMKSDNDAFYRINAKSSIGYNGDDYFYGLSFIFDSIANYSGIRLLANTYTVEIYSGFHF